MAEGFFGEGLPPGSRLWSKAGWTSETRHDAAIVALPDGPRFILVAFTVLALAATAGARTITGTQRSDRLVGTPRADVIRGLGGRDVLLGRGGADYLHGGGKADTLDAGPGADLIQAAYDGSRDTVRCGTGTDLVNADLFDSIARQIRSTIRLVRSTRCGSRPTG